MINQHLPSEDEEIIISSNHSLSTHSDTFLQHLSALQQVILDQQFQQEQTTFMTQHCSLISSSSSLNGQMGLIFAKYCECILKCISNKMKDKGIDFKLKEFLMGAQERKSQLTEEMFELLLSLQDFQIFKQILLDYRKAQEQQEIYNTLTVKANKQPETKKVKSNAENIFGNSNEHKHTQKFKNEEHKTLQELLIPETVLTVKGLRKC